MSGQSSCLCASVTWADIFLFCSYLLCPTCHLSCRRCQNKGQFAGMPRRLKNQPDSFALLFSLSWALIPFKLFVIAQKPDVWAEGSTPLQRASVLQCNIDICSTRSTTRSARLTKSAATQARPAWTTALKLFAHKLSELLISHLIFGLAGGFLGKGG